MKIISIGLYIVICLASLKSNKSHKYMMFLYLMFMACLFSFTSEIYDLTPYENFYNEVSFSNIIFINKSASSILFSIICSLFKFFHIDFYFFRFILFISSSLIIYKLYGKRMNVNIFLVYYSVLFK